MPRSSGSEVHAATSASGTSGNDGGVHRFLRSDFRFRQHPCRILGFARPIRGVLLQHLRHPGLACSLLPAGSDSRLVPLLEGGVSVLLVFIGVKMLIHDFFEIDVQ